MASHIQQYPSQHNFVGGALSSVAPVTSYQIDGLSSHPANVTAAFGNGQYTISSATAYNAAEQTQKYSYPKTTTTAPAPASYYAAQNRSNISRAAPSHNPTATFYGVSGAGSQLLSSSERVANFGHESAGMYMATGPRPVGQSAQSQRYQPANLQMAPGPGFSFNMQPLYNATSVPTFESPVEVRIPNHAYTNWWRNATSEVRTY